MIVVTFRMIACLVLSIKRQQEKEVQRHRSLLQINLKTFITVFGREQNDEQNGSSDMS